MNVGALMTKDFGWAACASRVAECPPQMFLKERPGALRRDAVLRSPEVSA